MYCPDCGAGARDDANYCLSCGYDLESEQRPDPDATVAAPPVGASRDPDATTEVPVAPIQVRQPRSEPAPRADLVNCAACDAPNASHRVSCGRCGADLASGEPGAPPRRARRSPAAPAPVDEGPPAVPEPRTARRRSRSTIRPGAVIAVVGALLGVVLGWAIVADAGPFADEVVVGRAPAVFDPQVYTGAPSRLVVATVEASSTQVPTGENRYDATLLFDNDPATAWNNLGSEAANGVGEFVRVTLDRPAWVTELLVANGYQKDDERYFGNARVEKLRVEFEGGPTFDVSLVDQQGMQSIRIPNAVLTDRITLRILASYDGTTYEDVGLSELEIHGHVAVGDDATRFDELPDQGATSVAVRTEVAP